MFKKNRERPWLGHRRPGLPCATTDPDARLFRQAKGHEAKLAYQGHVHLENRHGPAVVGCVTRASGYGERRPWRCAAT
jgi:hypothetical protein